MNKKDKKLCLSTENKIIAGVCGGMAEYFNVDPTLIRIIWVLILILGHGMPVVVYVVCWAIMPLSEQL